MISKLIDSLDRNNKAKKNSKFQAENKRNYIQWLMMAAFLLSSAIMAMTHGQWGEHSNPALPREDYMMAVGYYNQSIYLLYVQ